MLLTILVPGLLCLFNTVSAVDFGRNRVFETLAEVPPGWTQNNPASKEYRLKLRFVLAQPRLYEFEQLALDIATPGHPSYGQHLTKAELEDFIRPTDETFTQVTTWLQAAGFSSDDIVSQGASMSVTANISQVEELLQTRFHNYSNGNKTVVRALRYSLPSSLHEHIRFVQPTTRFLSTKPKYHSIKNSVPVDLPVRPVGFSYGMCDAIVTPVCLRVLYQMRGHTNVRFANNSFGISGYHGQSPSNSDLKKFLSTFSTLNTNLNSTFTSIGGAFNWDGLAPDDEQASLEVQYATALIFNQTVNYYSAAGVGGWVPDLDEPTPDSDENEPFLEQLYYLSSLPDSELPAVLSTSYYEDEQSVPYSYANATCNMFAQLGARGVSIIFNSGDTGVGSGCQSNDGLKTTKFLPTFPASCPWVTSVGGTNGLVPEVAVGFSSGGFSNMWTRPSWQEYAVPDYLNRLGDQWKGLYNPQGRGIPDVAARSVRYYHYHLGELRSSDGTACAAPVFAGVVSFLNEFRRGYNLSSLGFLNPFLYAGEPALYDIYDGGSSGCQGTDMFSGLPGAVVPYASWNATIGWDPVTGLGTPNATSLLAAMFYLTFPDDFLGGNWNKSNEWAYMLMNGGD